MFVELFKKVISLSMLSEILRIWEKKMLELLLSLVQVFDNFIRFISIIGFDVHFFLFFWKIGRTCSLNKIKTKLFSFLFKNFKMRMTCQYWPYETICTSHQESPALTEILMVWMDVIYIYLHWSSPFLRPFSAPANLPATRGLGLGQIM